MRKIFNYLSKRSADRATAVVHNQAIRFAALVGPTVFSVSYGVAQQLVDDRAVAIGVGVGAALPLGCAAAAATYWGATKILAPKARGPAP